MSAITEPVVPRVAPATPKHIRRGMGEGAACFFLNGEVGRVCEYKWCLPLGPS